MTIRLMMAVGLAPVLCAVAEGEVLPDGFPQRRGPLVFTPAATLVDPTPETLAWLSRFELILTNGYDLAPEGTRRELQGAGSRLFLYVWSNGFTDNEAQAELPQSAWWRELLERHGDWLLSREPTPGPPGTPDSYYFDLSLPAMRRWLALRIAGWRADTGYDGFFFDLAGATALPEHVLELWRSAHPGPDYNLAFAELLRAVRDADPEALLMANQAFETVPEASALVDYDLTESYGTSFAWGPERDVGPETLAETFLRPWDGPAGLRPLYGAVEEKLERAQPRSGFVYLDYMRPGHAPPAAEGGRWGAELDLEAVYYSYVAARLWGREAFCSGWYAGMEYRGPLYFADLGSPLGEGPQEVGGLVLREYERGLVALLAGPAAAEVEVRPAGEGVAALYDLFAGTAIPVTDGRARLRPEPSRSRLTATVSPVGRVYLKTKQ